LKFWEGNFKFLEVDSFMNKEKLKSYLGAFLAGGILGVIGQGVVMVYMYIALPFPVQSMIFTLGVIGGICSFYGLYQKLAPRCGMGLDMTLFGLASSMTMLIINARREQNKHPVVFGISAPVKVFGIGSAVALALALIILFAK
jgi:hypothetical protein